MPTDSGVFRDDTDTPVGGRIVRAYRRDTGALIGSAVSSDGLAIDGDPAWGNVSLCLLPEGTDGSSVMADASPYAHPLTASGGSAISSDGPIAGVKSLQVPTVGSVTAPASDSFHFGGGDFTVDFWMQSTQSSDAWVLGAYGRNPQSATDSSWIFLNSGGNFYLDIVTGGDNLFSFGPAAAVADGNWHHIEASRESGVLRCFLDGAQQSSTASLEAVKSITGGLILGGLTGTFEDAWAGSLSRVRVTKGVARHMGAFNPLTQPFYANAAVAATPLGSYSITHSHTGERQFVFLDDAGGTTYNDKIARVV